MANAFIKWSMMYFLHSRHSSFEATAIILQHEELNIVILRKQKKNKQKNGKNGEVFAIRYRFDFRLNDEFQCQQYFSVICNSVGLRKKRCAERVLQTNKFNVHTN